MKKKLYIMRAVKLIAFALAVVLMTLFLQSFLLRRIDSNTLRYEALYLEDKDSLDVVLIGASDVYAGYSAPYAYEKYGYTSYPYASQSTRANMLLPQIREVLKYQAPKLIIVEINSLLYRDDDIPAEVNQRIFTDSIPHDEIWRQFLEDEVPADERMEYYFPIIKFHGSWSDYPWKFKYLMAEMDQNSRGYALLRGFKTIANEFHPTGKIINDKLPEKDATAPLGVNGNCYLIRTLDYLKENGITNVVFTRFPHVVRSSSETRFQRLNEAQRIIESYGYDFINMERYASELGFDINKDWYNWDHLNIYGAEKLTDYLGGLIVNQYGVTGAVLNEQQKAEWENSVDYYHKLYNYTESLIEKRSAEGQNGDKGGKEVSEDKTSLSEIDKYAEEHPDAGKYGRK